MLLYTHVHSVIAWTLKGGDNMSEQQMKTLSEWLKDGGYVWIDGQERMYKGMVSATTAQVQIGQLLGQGAIKYA